MARSEEEIIELVNLVIDDEATEGERAELEALLETSPEVRALFEGVQGVASRLDGLHPIEPPRELRLGVLWQIRGMKQKSGRPRRRALFAVGWAAAAALVLAVFLLEPPRRKDTAATMAPAGTVVAQAPHLVIRKQGELYSLEPLLPGPITIELDRSLTIIGISGGTDTSFVKTKASFTLRPSERAAVIVRPAGRAGATDVRMTVGNQLFTTRFVLTD